jgi:crotonobetainyl-CoA:carnitine CoA-transferase CaiB-like acyl-CoA transferase
MVQQPTEYWYERLVEARVPVAPVKTLDAALADPQTQALGCVVNVEGVEGKPVPIVRNPVNLSSHQPTYDPVPQTGQHTAEVLQELLGYSQHKIEQLQGEGIVSLGEDGTAA